MIGDIVSTYKGKPCRACKKRLRYIKGDKCQYCNTTRGTKWRDNNIERHRQNSRDYLTKNKETIRIKCRNRRLSTPEKQLWMKARYRAKKKGLPFTLKIQDIKIPTTCPVLLIPIEVGLTRASSRSPTIDRIDNSKGYTKRNTICISWRANTLKRDATVQELIKVAEFYKCLTETSSKSNVRSTKKQRKTYALPAPSTQKFLEPTHKQVRKYEGKTVH